MRNLLFTALFTFISIGLIAQTDILPPQLKAPDSAAMNQMADVILDWYPVNGVGNVTYTLELDTNSQFQNAVTITTPTSAYNTENLTFDEVYFWRVKAADNTGTSDWSDINSYTVMNEVALTAPSDGSTGKSPDVTLVWSNRKGANFITGITFYDVELSLDTNFTTIDYSVSVPYGTLPADTNYYYVDAEYLLFDTLYYWRVRARHETDACDWSAQWSFSTVEDVTLISPADGAINQHVNIELTWETITGVDSYIYQLCTDPDFTVPCASGFVSHIHDSVVINDLNFGETYYWRMKAAHILDSTNWSEERSFEVINTVLLISPAEGDTAGLEPLLKWEPINGTDPYEVHYWSDDLSTMEIEFPETAEFQIYKPLDVGVFYNWKVRAYRNSAITEWSETRTFLSEASQGYGNLFQNMENINIYPNPTDGQLTIELNTNYQKSIQITIVDLLGKTVLENTFTSDQGLVKRTLNLEELNNGLYLIKLQSEGKMYTEKLVVDK